MQATLGTVVTNDPDQAAWLYLTARAAAAARHQHARRQPRGAAEKGSGGRNRRRRPPRAGSGRDDGRRRPAGGLGPRRAGGDVGEGGAADALLADTDADVGGRGIEVLLPDGEQELDAPSDADSEDFVR